MGTAGDPAGGALHADEAAEPRRDADRPAAVAAGGDRYEASGHGGGAAARGSARRRIPAPGVAGDSVELRRGAVEAAELAGRREADEVGTGCLEAGDHRAIAGGGAVGEQQRRIRVGPSLDLVELLDAYGHATQRKRHVGGLCAFEGTLGVDEREGVEVAGFDRRQSRPDLVDGRPLAAPEGLDQ